MGATCTGAGGKITNKDQIENIRKQLGVDQPYPVQLGYFAFEVANGFTCTYKSYTDPARAKAQAEGKPSACQAVRSWATNEGPKILATRIGPTR